MLRRVTLGILLAYWVFIFALTHLPHVGTGPSLPHSDKIAHLLSYALLAVLLVVHLRTRLWSRGRILVAVAVILPLYGVADELLQQLVPGRQAEWGDWLADLAGALLGSLFALSFWRVFPSRDAGCAN